MRKSQAQGETMSERANPPAEAPHRGGFVRNPQDFYGGLLLVLIALFALWAGSDLPGMRGFAFGPGTAPRLFAIALAAVGLAVAAIGFMTDGPPIERYRVRGPLLVTASVLAFALMIRPLGLAISAFVTVLIAAAASSEVRWRESLIAAVALTIFTSILFPFVLKLPFQIWPRF